MNCEEFRHQLLIDPFRDDAPFRAHACACSECAQAMVRVLRFERTLRTVLPAECFSDGTQDAGWSRSMRFGRGRGLLALLLLLLVAFLLGQRVGFDPGSGDNLGGAVIEHILSEEEHLQSTARISRGSLRSLFQSLGADVRLDLGPVHYAGRCVIAQGQGIHLVLAGKLGAVTALFMPESVAPEQPKIAGGGLAGTIVRAGSGSLAVVGEPGEPLESIARRLLTAVRWNFSERGK